MYILIPNSSYLSKAFRNEKEIEYIKTHTYTHVYMRYKNKIFN